MSDGGVRVGEGSVISSVSRGSAPICVVVGGGIEAGSVVGSEVRGRLEGVEAARPSQRYDRFEVGVAVGVGAGAAGPDLGKYARSRTRRARRFVFVVRPATFAVMWRKAPGVGGLTFCQRLVFSK